MLAEALWPGQNEKINQQVRLWRKLLEKDRLKTLLRQAREHLPHHGPRRKSAEREIQYLESNAERMTYATFIREGYFIGSGVVEAGCKTVVGKRTKQSGMFWRLPGAQHILTLRCAVLGDTEKVYWKYRRCRDLKALELAA